VITEPRRGLRSRPRWLRKSLTTNAVALMIATVATNALGLVFWAVAAHLRSPAQVGRAAAMVAALTLLATIAQLNLTNVFIRLVPTAGRHGRRLITRGYLAVIAFACLAGAVYVVSGLGHGVITGGSGAAVVFVIAVPVMAIFALQDSVLTALRFTPWVPVENVSFATARLALLPALVVLPAVGMIAAWVIPAAVAVAVVSGILFTRVLPARDALEGSLPGRRKLFSLVAGEYVGNTCATATAQLMPLLIVWRLGPAAAAYFTLPWLILMGITFLMWNVSSSLVVEVAGAHARSDELLRRSLMLWGAIVLGALIVCVLGAEPLLGLAGPGYAAHGAPLLRLLGLSAPFYAVFALYGTLAWLDQRVWMLAGFLAVYGVALLATTLALLPHLGLAAVGWANLAMQALTALAMAPLVVRRLRRGRLLEAS
jgi:O-antigen/teichoic acid export membrane protein